MKKILITASIIGVAAACGTFSRAGNTNGSAGNMPALYDCETFTINLFELPPGGESSTLNKNTQINTIYMDDNDKVNGHPFVAVLDAILADGFNPLWQEVQVKFINGHTPIQLCSDDQILAAVTNGVVSVTATGELYRCAVVGTP